MSLIVLLLLPFIGSCIAAFLPHNARNAESFLAGLVALTGALQVALWYPQIVDGGVIREEYFWLPSLGLNFVLRMDGFAWLFSMLVLGIGALVSLYARYYMSPDDPVPRFFAFFLAFMGAMLGLVLSGNIIQIVFFWELTSLFSFLLIGYWHHRSDARRGAYMALLVTGAGGLALLAGMLILGHVVGSYDLDRVLEAGDAIRAHALYPVLLTLILIGALSKSAQFPFHFWLPHAMPRPRPSRPTCTRRPWSRPGCFCWRVYGRRCQALNSGSGSSAGLAPVPCCWGRMRRFSRMTSKACWLTRPSATWA